MVKVCPNAYPKQQEEKYAPHFSLYPFPLSSFQKYAIEAIVEGNHILVTAHTGSGKTLPAEFAIEYFVKTLKKKVIYTSPIKALSNQKFYEFTKKFPDISFGILTGDIKSNPEADVLIMTTEILQNSLYNQSKSTSTKPLVDFQINLETELGCVVFDEVHYINDPDRGKVWEETIMLLPRHIQIVMLSATLDAPEKFAFWCENRDHITQEQDKKIVYLTTTYERVVPLTHYSFITTSSSAFKVIKDKEVQEEIKAVTNKLMVMQSATGEFNETNYFRMKKVLTLLENKNVQVKRAHVINKTLEYCVENEMLPALCFVFSRKMLEVCAREVTTNLLEFDSKVPYIVRNECEQIIRRLPNYKEYLELPEYLFMVSLLEKGVAIHHAGIMPVLREMVELLYSKGYIKVLFATETFAVGINMPTKTVIFTDVNKFDGTSPRILYSHEYTQMAGRAGRRGIDTIGHVIHLHNIFRNVDSVNYKQMLKGKPQTLTSKFKISYNLLLNILSSQNPEDLFSFAQKSMIQLDIDNQLGDVYQQIAKNQSQQQQNSLALTSMRTPFHIVEEYITLSKKVFLSINKEKRKIQTTLNKLAQEYPSIDKDKEQVKKVMELKKEEDSLQKQYSTIHQSIREETNEVLQVLLNNGFIVKEKESYTLTHSGQIASQMREIACLPFAYWISQTKNHTHLTAIQLTAIFSCFTNITPPEDKRRALMPPNGGFPELYAIQQEYMRFEDLETKHGINTGTDYSIHNDLLGYIEEWCSADSPEKCKLVLQSLSLEKEIFLGEFVKALLKINNISCEMEKVSEMTGNIEFLSKMKEIPNLTLKYVVTNQSLYV